MASKQREKCTHSKSDDDDDHNDDKNMIVVVRLGKKCKSTNSVSS